MAKNPKRYWLTVGRDEVTCAEHFHRGELPCPWPDCANGTADPEISGVLPGNDEYNRRMVRRPWVALDGSERFAWDEPEKTSYFKTIPLVRAELERALPPSEEISTVYHYTTVDGLMGILKSDDLWLTDYEFLNDATEVRHGLSLLDEVLDSLAAGTSDSRRKQLLETWREEAQAESRYRICLACFSKDGDSLSQWRGYGGGVSAVAIGFDLQGNLFRCLRETLLGPVIYSPEIQRLQLAIAAHVHLELDAWDTGKARPSNHDIFASGTFDRLFRYLVFLKHHAFAEEREVRLVYAEHTHLFEAHGEPVAPQRFRTRGGRIVPYTSARDLELPDQRGMPVHDALRIGRLPISEVVIGPQESPDLLALGIARLLVSLGRTDVQVKRSEVPFRPAT